MLNDTISDSLITLLGREGYLVLAFGLMLGVPLGLAVLFVVAFRKRYSQRFGLLFGFALAIWANLCWVVVPACGAYPNVPGLLIGGALFGLDTWGQEIFLLVTNLILFPFIGRSLFRVVGQRKVMPPPFLDIEQQE